VEEAFSEDCIIYEAARLFALMIGTAASGRASAGAETDLIHNADDTYKRIRQFWQIYKELFQS
jgi:hypothetical protein